LLLVTTGSLFFLPGLTLYRELTRRPDIWWTPPSMALSLTASRDRVEIYAGGVRFDALLDAGRLWITDDTASRPLRADEIGLRFNNWDRVRAARLPTLLASAAACGAGAVLLLLIATGRLAYRGENAPVSA
jgi:hypothetical protein